jgi:hypothetical protein
MRCSFCRRTDAEVAKLAAGPKRLFLRRAYICDRCAAQTIKIMEACAGDARPPGGDTQSVFRRAMTALRWKLRHHQANLAAGG